MSRVSVTTCSRRTHCAVVCRRGAAFAIALFVAALPGAHAGEPDLSHILTSRWAVGLDDGATQLLDLGWRPEARWRFDDGGRLTGRLRLRVQTESGTRPGDLERDSYAPSTRPRLIGDKTELALRELYYERPLGDWYLTLGKQQVVWGKADGLKVLDVVDPQSFREFILEDFDQSRIPLWTVNLERSAYGWMGGDWTLQVLWIPDRSYHALPRPGATWAFSSPRLVPQAPPGVTVVLDDAQTPDASLRNSDAGVRLSGFVGGWDLTLNYLYQYDNRPALHQRVQPGPVPVVTVTPRYHRTHIAGATFSRAFGDWVLRGELGYFTDRYYLTDDPADTDGVDRAAETSYVLGLDWSGLDDTFVSFQLFQSRLHDRRPGLTQPRLDTNLTLLVRHESLNDTLTAEVLWILNSRDGDGLVRPRVGYDVEENLEVWLAADLFYGTSRGLYGQFDDNDRMVLGLKLGL